MRRGTDSAVARAGTPFPGAGRDAVMRSAALFLMVVLPLAGCQDVTQRVEMKRIERPAFIVSMPDWRIDIDEGAGLTGRYKVSEDGAFAEIGWSPDSVSDVADLELIAGGLSAGFDISQERLPSLDVPGQVRLDVRGNARGQLWLLMSLIRCVDAGVLLTLSAVDKDLRKVERIHAAILESLVCSQEDLSGIVAAWPSSDLPVAFGAHFRDEILLADADGRWLRVVSWSPSVIRKMEDSPDNARRILLSLGSILGEQLQSNGIAERSRHLGGVAMVWRVARESAGVMTVTAFHCPKSKSAFLVLASDLHGKAGFRDLKALSLRFDCPGGKGRPVLERPDICEVGAVELCEAFGGALSAPAEDEAG